MSQELNFRDAPASRMRLGYETKSSQLDSRWYFAPVVKYYSCVDTVIGFRVRDKLFLIVTIIIIFLSGLI